MKITVKRREHPLYTMYGICDGKPAFNLLGRYQYMYTLGRRKISLIALYMPFDMGGKVWEAYGYRTDPTQFRLKKEAEEYIFKVLNR